MYHVCLVATEARRMYEIPWLAVSCHVGIVNQTQVLCKSIFFLITKLSFQHLKTSYHYVIRLA